MGLNWKRIGTGFATGGLSELGGARSLIDSMKPKYPGADYNAMLNADKQNALFNFKLNNNISNPFGNQEVVSDGMGGWKTNISYAKPIQDTISGYQSMLPGLQQRIASRLSMPSAFDDPNYRQNLQDAMLSRMNFGADEESLRTRLANQGLTEGSEGWNREMNVFNQGKNDARLQAFLASGQEMGNLLNLENQARMAPISEAQGVAQTMYGSAPQFSQFQSNYNLTNPVAQQYQQSLDKANAQNAMKGQLMNGLFQLGSTAVMASDRRLKSNIVRIGDHPLGIGIYEYDIGGRRQVGVMAQEVQQVKPEAVISHPAGYLMVDYGAL